ELLLFQLKMQSLKYRQKLQQGGVIQEIEHDALEGFIHSLPYKLTTAQDRVLQDIFKDMTSPVQMNRLLQGDVGSGKTGVDSIMLCAISTAVFKGAFMVPTDILT